MKVRNKGQSVVEFALVVPMLVFMFLSVIYIGVTFLDYTQFSNAARDAARDVSLQRGFENQQILVDKINSNDADQLARYATQLTKLFKPTWHAEFLKNDGKTIATNQSDAADVHITITLSRDDLPSALEALNILPKDLKPIDYKMRLEN